MFSVISITLEQFINLLLTVIRGTPLLATLLIMMALDIFAGILVAINKRTLNSTTSFRGITKKVFMLILVAVGVTLGPFTVVPSFPQGIPIAQMIALAYIITEAISITENAAVLGVPVPMALVRILQKLREEEQKKLEQKLPKLTLELPLNSVQDNIVEIKQKPTTDTKTDTTH